MRRVSTAGFTLVELLVGIALMGVVLVALLSFFSQGTRASTQVNGRAEIQQEILGAQQLIGGRLREAWYVFPSGTALSLGDGGLRRNPTQTTATGNWTVGTHPILALILPPRVAGATCAIPTSEDDPANINGESNEQTGYKPASGGGNDGCYRFFAYYPVKRSQWTSSVLSTGASHPGVDTANGETWVLAEYRDYYYPTTSSATTPPPAPVPSTTSPAIPVRSPVNRSKVYLVADYIAPTIATTGFTTLATATTVDNTYTMFTYTQEAGQPVTAVTMKLATIRKTGGTTLRLPDKAGTYTTTVLLTNQGKMPAN